MTRWELAHRFDRLAQRERDRARLRRAVEPAEPTEPTEPTEPRPTWWLPVESWSSTANTSYVLNGTWTAASTNGITAHWEWADENETWLEWANERDTWLPYTTERRAIMHVRLNEWRDHNEWREMRPPDDMPARRSRLAEYRARLAPSRTPQQVRIISQRAKELLNSVLTEHQRQWFIDHGYIPVVGGLTKLQYHVVLGRQHNIKIVDPDGHQLWDVCVHVADAVPDYDNVAAQVLGLQYNERLILQTANLSRLRTGAVDPRELLERVA